MLAYITRRGEDFIIGRARKGGLILEKIRLNELYGTYVEECIENTEYLGEVVPANGFFVIGYRCNYKDEVATILVELLSQNKKERCNIDLFFDDEKVTRHGGYKISYRFARMCDCSIIPDRALSHLCDMLIIISDQTSVEHSPSCNIF